MVNDHHKPPQANGAELYNHEEYYLGNKDKESRRNGTGENHWTGPYSLEWYEGRFTQDTLHGEGEYRWRHRGGAPPSHRDVTYEGRMFANQLHGYGCMSYPDGVTFNGLYHSDMRWGPGVESCANLRENVGLWSGRRLVRLTWRPAAPSIIPDLLSVPSGREYIEPFRTILMHHVNLIGKTNKALELLKQFGADPVAASKHCSKLYPKHCTDLNSQLCNKDAFDYNYYKGKINELKEISVVPVPQDDSQISGESSISRDIHYAWNNNKMAVHIMKHCFTHEEQRAEMNINLPAILHGPRSKFHPAGEHEIQCRSLLMSSYLGNVIQVTNLVNEKHLYPDVADIQGNTALMYAVCGDKTDIIHFLVEAGANVNSYNDSCFTPLVLALIRFLCIQKDIKPSQVVQSVLPPQMSQQQQHQITAQINKQSVSEWIISRELPTENTPASTAGTVVKSKVPPSKLGLYKKERSLQAIKEISVLNKIKSEFTKVKDPEACIEDPSDSTVTSIEQQYLIIVNDLLSLPTTNPGYYLFVATDMVQEVLRSFYESKKVVDKNVNKKPILKEASKLKNNMKQSKEVLYQNPVEKEVSLTNIQKEKLETLQQVKCTITQLLADGAKPSLVRCPQPALLLATISRTSDVVRQLVAHGSDIHEKYPQMFNYSALDVAVSEPLTIDNLEVIKTLLECGSKTNDRLDYYEIVDGVPSSGPGPTLLHAVLAKNLNNVFEEELCHELLILLLQYKCDPTVQFQGRSAIDMAMSRKIQLLDIFIKSPTTNLNAVINDSQQTILVKMFSMAFFRTLDSVERLEIFTNLLLFGADPLIECQDDTNHYSNIFVYADQCLKKEIQKEKTVDKVASKTLNLDHLPKGNKKDDKQQKNPKQVVKTGKADAEMLLADYKQALELVANCSRVLITRRLEARLLELLVQVVDKYKHREWNMILKEHKNKKCTALWLNPQRCLEIYDIMKKAKKKLYVDEKVLKYVLSFIIFYNKRLESKNFRTPIVTKEKNEVDKEVCLILRENKGTNYSEDFLQRKYVKPELDEGVEKLDVCYECIMPLTKNNIRCKICRLVSFCSYECIEINVMRIGGHPCSSDLKQKYFSELNLEKNDVV